MPGLCNGAITNWPVKSSVAIETLESNQSHYVISVFIGELVLIHNGHKLDKRHQKFMIVHAVDILLIFT
jgi:hypothetical protein